MKNFRLAFAATLFAAAGLAQAQQTAATGFTYGSGLSRAQVQAQLDGARAQGLVNPETGLVGPGAQVATSASRETRAEVKAELDQARQRGELDVTAKYDGALVGPNAQRAGSQVAVASTVTRAQVREELAQAQREGRLQPGADLIGLVGPTHAPTMQRLSLRRVAEAGRPAATSN